jgi:tetratricopeptide (TPR) repeat protein
MHLAKMDRGYWILNTQSLSRRIVFSLLVIVLVLPVIYRSYCIYRADRIVRSGYSEENFTKALQYDPGNATLWWRRGRLLHYRLESTNISEVARNYEHALSLNPRLSQAWVDLSDCYERMGRVKEAEKALKQAISTHRYSPLVQWQAGNFYLRQGNLPRMYECFKLAGQYESDKLGIAIETAWKMDSDHKGMLEKLIPDQYAANMTYLNFLISRDELDLARVTWQRSLKNAIPANQPFQIASVFRYIDRLLAKNLTIEALQVWDTALRKTRSGLTDTRIYEYHSGKPESVSQNMIWNGSFENEILLGGFDWRYDPNLNGVRFHVDSGNRIDKLKSLQVIFGDVNISSNFLTQIIPVKKAGRYRLEFLLRTEGLTTDQMPYLQIAGYPDSTGASGRSDFFPPSTSWSKLAFVFEVKHGCSAVQLSLCRDQSLKFDNQIKGSLWMDGFILKPQEPEKTIP